jgi:hypothetical protein
MWGEVVENNAAAGVETLHSRHVDDTTTPIAARDDRHDVNGFGDERSLGRDVVALRQAIEPQQRTIGSRGVARAAPARMAGCPHVEQIEGFSAPHFPDDNSVGARPEG